MQSASRDTQCDVAIVAEEEDVLQDLVVDNDMTVTQFLVAPAILDVDQDAFLCFATVRRVTALLRGKARLAVVAFRRGISIGS